jgi:hypothetical protein
MNTFLHLFQQQAEARKKTCDLYDSDAAESETETRTGMDVRTEAREEMAQTRGLFMSPYRML